MKKIIVLALMLLAVVSTAQAKTKFDIETAITNAEHKALAQYYSEQAHEQTEIAEMHLRMAKNYRGTHANRSTSRMIVHCNKLKLQALKMAEEYNAMAEIESALK